MCRTRHGNIKSSWLHSLPGDLALQKSEKIGLLFESGLDAVWVLYNWEYPQSNTRLILYGVLLGQILRFFSRDEEEHGVDGRRQRTGLTWTFRPCNLPQEEGGEVLEWINRHVFRERAQTRTPIYTDPHQHRRAHTNIRILHTHTHTYQDPGFHEEVKAKTENVLLFSSVSE